jgi:hypothetical protein
VNVRRDIDREKDKIKEKVGGHPLIYLETEIKELKKI